MKDAQDTRINIPYSSWYCFLSKIKCVLQVLQTQTEDIPVTYFTPEIFFFLIFLFIFIDLKISFTEIIFWLKLYMEGIFSDIDYVLRY